MNRKRTAFDKYSNIGSKRSRLTENIENVEIKNVRSTLLHLRESFPVDKFDQRLPPIIFKHQLYSLLENRTHVDKEVEELRQSCEIRLFKLGPEANVVCIVFTEDYKSHVIRSLELLDVDKGLIDIFVSKVILTCPDISINRDKLLELQFDDKKITKLLTCSVLTVRDVGSWWVAIPNAGLFMSSFDRGRKTLLAIIRKTKFKEILKTELENRPFPKSAKLGLAYHIHDLIGGDFVECMTTTSGVMLRLS